MLVHMLQSDQLSLLKLVLSRSNGPRDRTDEKMGWTDVVNGFPWFCIATGTTLSTVTVLGYEEGREGDRLLFVYLSKARKQVTCQL